jgi:hypothetical protein
MPLRRMTECIEIEKLSEAGRVIVIVLVADMRRFQDRECKGTQFVLLGFVLFGLLHGLVDCSEQETELCQVTIFGERQMSNQRLSKSPLATPKERRQMSRVLH